MTESELEKLLAVIRLGDADQLGWWNSHSVDETAEYVLGGLLPTTWLATGVELEDGVAVADRFRVVERSGSRALVEITLHEGRKHIVRRMLAAVGHPVSRLVRTTVGPIRLGSQRPGTTRELTTREIGELYAAVGL